jgi:hypothetical protein
MPEVSALGCQANGCTTSAAFDNLPIGRHTPARNLQQPDGDRRNGVMAGGGGAVGVP